MNDQPAVQRATMALLLAQASASAGFLAMTTVNAIVVTELSGSNKLAGVPSALVLAGAAVAAYLAGSITPRIGRRNALILGSSLGVLGALVASIGIQASSMWLFLPALLVFGMGRGALDQGRYAAADLVAPGQRGRAISTVVWGGTIGAVLGPQLVGPASTAAARLGIVGNAGPSVATAILVLVAGLIIGGLTMGVDFRGIARRVGATDLVRPSASRWPVLAVPRARAAMITMACAQSAMSLMMTIISVYMKQNEGTLAGVFMDHGHVVNVLDEVGTVITAHVLGMFFFSPLVGRLADRIGRAPTIMIGVAVLSFGCIFTPLTLNTPLIALGEFSVGLGWSLCYVSGSTMLTNALAPEQRAQSQGTNDLIVNVASAVGSLSSGLLLDLFGFYPVCAFGLFMALLPLLAVMRWGRGDGQMRVATVAG